MRSQKVKAQEVKRSKRFCIKFPILKGKINYFPKNALCPWCKRNKVLEPHSMVVLTAGAYSLCSKKEAKIFSNKTATFFSDKNNKLYGPSKSIYGYFAFLWHGAHNGGEGKYKEIDVWLDVATDVIGGQFDICFCSTECLRSFLNYCIDVLEENIKNAKKLESKE